MIGNKAYTRAGGDLYVEAPAKNVHEDAADGIALDWGFDREIQAFLNEDWFRQLDLAPFDLLIWPHSAGESKSLYGTAVGPCGNCGKRFVLSKPLWESAL